MSSHISRPLPAAKSVSKKIGRIESNSMHNESAIVDSVENRQSTAVLPSKDIDLLSHVMLIEISQ